MNQKQPYAEDLPYWKTSRSTPDAWLDKVKEEIRRAGGKVLSTMYGDDNLGRAAYMIYFQFGEDQFRMVWPCLQSKTGCPRFSRLQG